MKEKDIINALEGKFGDCKKIVDELLTGKDHFDSHAFIQMFSQNNQKMYAEWAYKVAPEARFLYVHSAMATFLKKNEARLGIKGNGKTRSKNIFGKVSSNEKWEKK